LYSNGNTDCDFGQEATKKPPGEGGFDALARSQFFHNQDSPGRFWGVVVATTKKVALSTIFTST
jgi:hypothetical protein